MNKLGFAVFGENRIITHSTDNEEYAIDISADEITPVMGDAYIASKLNDSVLLHELEKRLKICKKTT